LDIEYRDSTKRSNTALPPRWATYYLCRFELQDGVGTVSTGEVVKYHDAHGVVGPDTMLSLRLCDFCPRKNSDPIYPSVDISHQELANILNQADGVQNTRDNPVVASVSDDDEPPVVQKVQYRYPKRPAPDADNETENELEDEDEALSSSFDGPTMSIADRSRRRKSVGRHVKKAKIAAETEPDEEEEEDAADEVLH